MTFFKKVVLYFRLVPGIGVSVGGLKLICTNICLKLYMFFYFRDKFQVCNVTLPDFWTEGICTLEKIQSKLQFVLEFIQKQNLFPTCAQRFVLKVH